MSQNQWHTLTSVTPSNHDTDMDVIVHYQEVIKILSNLESQLGEKHDDAKGFYEDDGEEQSLGEMNAYKEAQKMVGLLLYDVGRTMRNLESSRNNYSFTYNPAGHLGI